MRRVLPGQGLWIKGFHANGAVSKSRPFLIIDITQNTLIALNVSSLRGKERKLLIPSNKKLKIYNPPFPHSSFVKLDELYIIDYFSEIGNAIMDRGRTLDAQMLDKVRTWHSNYAANNEIQQVRLSKEQLLSLNPGLLQLKSSYN